VVSAVPADEAVLFIKNMDKLIILTSHLITNEIILFQDPYIKSIPKP